MAHTLKAYYYTDPATAVTVDFYGAVSDNDGIAVTSYQMGVPGIDQARNSSLYSDYPRPVYSKHGTVTDVLTVDVRGSTNTNLYANLHLLAKLGEYARVGTQNPYVKATPYLELKPGGSASGEVLYAPIYACRVELPPDWANSQDARLTIEDVTVTIERGIWQAVAPGSFYTSFTANKTVLTGAFLGGASSSIDIGGDTTALFHVYATHDTIGTTADKIIIGYRSKSLGGGNYANLGLKEAEDQTNGTDTSDQVDATANGGNCVRCTFTTATLATRLSGENIPMGVHRVFARMKITGTAVATVNLKYQDDVYGNSSYVSNSSVSVSSTTWYVYDMGIVRYFDSGLGAIYLTTATGSWAIDALKSSGTGNLDIDYLFFMPTEGYLTASGFRIEALSDANIVDFNNATGGFTVASVYATQFEKLFALQYTVGLEPLPGPFAVYWMLATTTGSNWDVPPGLATLELHFKTNPRFLMPSEV